MLQFSYRDHVVNLLETPGHRDFSEDTYRTLAAADAAVSPVPSPARRGRTRRRSIDQPAGF